MDLHFPAASLNSETAALQLFCGFKPFNHSISNVKDDQIKISSSSTEQMDVEVGRERAGYQGFGEGLRPLCQALHCTPYTASYFKICEVTRCS
jgi:hypothetical protein